MAKGIVYNVSPDKVSERAGRFGTYVFPGKTEGEQYSKTVVEDQRFLHDMGNDQKEWRTQDGYELAKDLVSRNKARGLFAKEFREEPTAAEVSAAVEVLSKEDTRLISEASSMWEHAHDHKLINDEARRAARRKGYKVEWALDDSYFSVIQCPFCKESVKRNASKCRFCNEFLVPEINPNLEKIGWSREKAAPVLDMAAVVAKTVEAEQAFAVAKVKR